MFFSRTAVIASVGTIVGSYFFALPQAFLFGAIILPMPFRFLGLLSTKFVSETGVVAGFFTVLCLVFNVGLLYTFLFGGILSTFVFHMMIYKYTINPDIEKRICA